MNRTLGERSDLVYIECGRVGSQDGAGLGHSVELLEHSFLHAHLFEHGFDDEVAVFQVVIAQSSAQQRHALCVLVFLELALLDLGFVVLLDRGNATVQGFLLGFQNGDRNACVQEVHADTATHGACTDHAHFLNVALGGVRRHIWNLAGSTLCKEQVAQCARFRRPHQVDEQLALVRQAIGKLALGGGFHGVHALGGRREILGHAFDHVARKLEVRVAFGVLARQVAHQGQRAHIGNAGRKSQGFFCQGFGRCSHLVEQLLAGHRTDHFALDGLAAHDHVERGLDTHYAGQALRAAGTGQDAQLHFGQRHLATRGAHAVVAAQGQLQPTAHAHRVNGSHHGLARVLHRVDDGVQVGFLHRLVGTEFLDVGPAGEGTASARDDDGFDGGIGIGPLQTVHNALPGGKTKPVDGRVRHGDHGNRAVDFVFSGHAVVPCKVKKNGRAILL